jgi:acylpyruvate hydrolase
MRLVTLRYPGHDAPGVLVESEILDLVACRNAIPAAGAIPNSLRGILQAGEETLDFVRRILERARVPSVSAQLRETGALVESAKARLAAPIPDPSVILSGGMNYHGHLKEMNTPVPTMPTAFVKSSSAVIGPGAPIVLPASNPDMVDWEGEFCAVIGKLCHGASAAQALDYVAGYTLINDVSARDWVAAVFSSTGIMGPIHAWEHNLLGKQFPTFCPMGPVLATKDEIANPESVQLTTTLNGTVMQSANTGDLVFSVAKLIEHFSKFHTFQPGDVITTGSPAGVGYGRKPKIFMKAGDVIEVKADGIGVLSNPVVGP